MKWLFDLLFASKHKKAQQERVERIARLHAREQELARQRIAAQLAIVEYRNADYWITPKAPVADPAEEFQRQTKRYSESTSEFDSHGTDAADHADLIVRHSDIAPSSIHSYSSHSCSSSSSCASRSSCSSSSSSSDSGSSSSCD